MRARVSDGILYIHKDDVPPFKKGGSVVRNSYFWAMNSISCRAYREKDWEFESEVWFALARMLNSFTESGYLGLRETQLEFEPDDEIPELLRSASTWL